MSTQTIAERPSTVPRFRPVVPWVTVLSLAAVMAYADGFWMTVLRGAIGAIERTQSPFSSWWHESTLSIPIFAVAVLGALTLARRWFGPTLRNLRTTAATAAMIVVATTLAGIAEIAASSAYDYHLQSRQLRMMSSMGGSCTGSCLVRQQHETLAVHIHGVTYISQWLLLTNAVLVVWMIALWGGRLKVTAEAGRELPATGSRFDSLRILLVAGLLGAAAIHAAVVPEHLTEWTAAGAFFVLLTAGEIAVAGLLLAHVQQRAVLLAAAVLSGGPLLLWLYSRAAGLPLGPDAGTREAIGLPDLVACALEIGTLIAAVVVLRAATRLRQRPPVSEHARALALVAVVAVTAIGLAGTEVSWFTALGNTGSQSHMHTAE